MHGEKSPEVSTHTRSLGEAMPQVAAQGHQHLFVRKQQTRNSTRTCIDQLDDNARVQEVARMLGGVDLTDESLAHARKLLSVAH